MCAYDINVVVKYQYFLNHIYMFIVNRMCVS